MGVSWLHLDIQSATVAAAALGLFAAAVRPARRRWSDLAAAGAVEAALVCALFALWQIANTVAHHHVSGGLANGRWVWHAERVLHVPSETWWQQLVLPHAGIVRASNYYYATAHLTGMVVFLVWLWLRHREHYGRWRTTVAIFTGLALLVQTIPVAPPRLISGTNLVDTAQMFNQSVYQVFDFADQYAAMPSIHVGWAVLIAVAAWQCSRGLFRYVGLAHGIATTLIVVLTANHYWFDGLGAVLLLAAAWAAARVLERRVSLVLVPAAPLALPSAVTDGTMAS